MSLGAHAWTRFAERYAVGDVIQVQITRVLPYGAEVEVVGFAGVEGLIHVSELSERRSVDAHEIVSELDLVDARIAKIDAPRRRLGLSLRRPESNSER